MSTDAHQREPLRLLLAISGNWDNATAAYAVDLAESLSLRGHEVCFVARPESPAFRAAKKAAIHRIEPLEMRSFNPFEAIGAVRRFYRLYRELRPHVINVFYSAEHVLADIVTGGNTPIVRTRAGPRRPKPHIGNRLLYQRAAANIAVADFIYSDHFDRLGVPQEKRALIRPGIDVDRFRTGAPDKAEARRRLGLDADAVWIGLVARFTRAKAHPVLLEAFRQLSARRSEPFKLLLTGIEYDVRISELADLAQSMGIADRVRFISGKVGDVRDALRALDVLAVPSISSEAIARIAVEGLALGIPTVASRHNSLPEIVGDAGLLVKPGEAEALSAAIEQALFDDAFRSAAAIAGPDRIRRLYSLEEKTVRSEELFYRLT